MGRELPWRGLRERVRRLLALAGAVVAVWVICCAVFVLPWSPRCLSSSTGACESREALAKARLLRQLHSRVHRRTGGALLQQDLEGESGRPWAMDGGDTCSHYHTRFGRGLTPVLLVSLPCSGSTWLRYLLEGATGLFMGSTYNDTLLYRGGRLGGGGGGSGGKVGDGRTLVYLTHGAASQPDLETSHDLQVRYESVDNSLPTILLLLDPARAIKDYWQHLNAPKKQSQAASNEETYDSDSFRNFVGDATAIWEEMATDRLLWTSAPLHVLHFEDLEANPLLHLRRLLHFLSVPADEGRLACLAAHLAASFKHDSLGNVDPFLSKEKERIFVAAKRVDRLLELLQYPRLPRLEHRQRLS